TPPSTRKSTYGPIAASSSASPASVSGVSAAASAPRNIPPTLSSEAMQGLRVERDGEILHVTLARPERRNAFDAALIADLTAAFADVSDARAVVLAGEGETFCAGADIDWQRSAIDLTYEENDEDALKLYRMCETIDRCPAPVVARIQGHALGGGTGPAACADIAIAPRAATVRFTGGKLGIRPAGVAAVVLPATAP